jgi:hypothetical protein
MLYQIHLAMSGIQTPNVIGDSTAYLNPDTRINTNATWNYINKRPEVKNPQEYDQTLQ